jgi:SRSO17 transposase
VPDEQRFMTKPQIARDLIATALEAGIPCAYVLADALYGSDKGLRVMLEQRQQPMCLPCARTNGSWRVRRTPGPPPGLPMPWPRAIGNGLPAGEGAEGPRLYDWTCVRLFRLQEGGQRFDHWLLVRRRLRDPSERAYYVVFAPAEVSLTELADVAGLRWTIETCFETAKDELGLDHCEVRPRHAWHRHMTLVMAAFGFLAKLRADLLCTSMPEAVPGKRNERSLRRVGAHS